MERIVVARAVMLQRARRGLLMVPVRGLQLTLKLLLLLRMLAWMLLLLFSLLFAVLLLLEDADTVVADPVARRRNDQFPNDIRPRLLHIGVTTITWALRVRTLLPLFLLLQLSSLLFLVRCKPSAVECPQEQSQALSVAVHSPDKHKRTDDGCAAPGQQRHKPKCRRLPVRSDDLLVTCLWLQTAPIWEKSEKERRRGEKGEKSFVHVASFDRALKQGAIVSLSILSHTVV
jgi:hypothetical protein